MHSASFNYENVAVPYQHIYGKSKHTYTFFPSSHPISQSRLPTVERTSLRISMRRQMFKQTKKKPYKVAANQILNWHIYISFTKSEISYKPNHCRHLARVFAVRMYSDSHQVPLYAWHNNTSLQCQSSVVLLADAAYI